jgi:hypothetical protein
MVRSTSWFYIRLAFDDLDLAGLYLKFERTDFPECRLRHVDVDVGTAASVSLLRHICSRAFP